MKFSITGQDKGDLLIQVTVSRGDHMSRFDCIKFLQKEIDTEFIQKIHKKNNSYINLFII